MFHVPELTASNKDLFLYEIIFIRQLREKLSAEKGCKVEFRTMRETPDYTTLQTSRHKFTIMNEAESRTTHKFPALLNVT